MAGVRRPRPVTTTYVLPFLHPPPQSLVNILAHKYLSTNATDDYIVIFIVIYAYIVTQTMTFELSCSVDKSKTPTRSFPPKDW